ncbi:hypothetical protein EMIT0P218_30114 [Pseudomonas sp. IT-P218]
MLEGVLLQFRRRIGDLLGFGAKASLAIAPSGLSPARPHVFTLKPTAPLGYHLSAQSRRYPHGLCHCEF